VPHHPADAAGAVVDALVRDGPPGQGLWVVDNALAEVPWASEQLSDGQQRLLCLRLGPRCTGCIGVLDTGVPVLGMHVLRQATGVAVVMATHGRAHVAVYRVCNATTCLGSDVLTGVEAAIVRGCPSAGRRVRSTEAWSPWEH
jgi:hypothetical protein